jgi:hypothetical protein
MSELHRVTTIPGLRGMRIRVQDILDLLAAGANRAEILADYPYLEDGDITAALEYASRQRVGWVSGPEAFNGAGKPIPA